MAPVRSIQNSRAPWQKRAASVPMTATTNPFGAPVVVQHVSIYNWVTQDTGDTKETAYANTFDDWGCHGCDWKFWVLAALARMKILISGTAWSLPNRDAASQKAQTQGAHEKGKRLSSPKYTGRKGKRKRKNIQVLEN